MKISKMSLLLGALALLGMVSTPLAAQTKTIMTKQEQANLKVVFDWWLVLQSGHPELVSKYVAPDIVQHNPNFPSGLKAFQDMVGRRKAVDPMPTKLTPEQMPAVAIARGDMVALMFKREGKDPADPSQTYTYFSFDSFRLKDGKIVEHWDAGQKNPPKS